MTQKVHQNIHVTRRCSQKYLVIGVSILLLLLVLSGLLHPRARATLGKYTTPLSSPQNTSKEIPNFVHYVHIVPPGSASKNATLEFKFRDFISYYSAQFYLNPDAIFIHTNAGPELIQQARDSDDQWTRAVANLPAVRFNHVTPPTHTSKGVQISLFAHQSDIIRTRAVRQFGGIYLDEDMYVIRDLTDLRRSGFQTIVGLQQYSDVCNGMFLAKPESELLKVFDTLQDIVFDGGWVTHSVDLLSRLVPAFAVLDHEVLVLDEKAFFAFSWEDWGTKELYQLHEPDGQSDPYRFQDYQHYNFTSFVQSFKPGSRWAFSSWRFDWRFTYAVHGWGSASRGKTELFGKYGGLTLEYILAHNSNFARAVYPAIKHALEAGVIKQKDS